MSKTLTSLLTLCVVAAFVSPSAADIWDGPSIMFEKDNFSDWTLPENQDWITPNVIITRKDLMGIFNIAQEDSYSNFVSPVDTEWAYGTTADIDSLSFTDWKSWHGSNPSSSVGLDAVLHLISDDIYIDIRFTSWTLVAGNGGGFSYVRSTPGAVPEPTSGLVFLMLSGLVAFRRKR